MKSKQNRKAIKMFLRKRNALISVSLILCISILFLTSCGFWKETLRTERIDSTEQAGDKQMEELSSVQNPSKLSEITIDFPFPYSMEEYTLTLVPSESSVSDSVTREYDIRLCDETGRVIQQFPCGSIGKKPRFSYDDLAYDSYKDLQIFSFDETGETFEGVLFAWDWEGHKFNPQAIKIPVYDESRQGDMLVSKEHGDCLEQYIYQVNQNRGEYILLRQWTLQKDSQILKIRDCIEGQDLFEGKVSLDENGELVNAKYYQTLFWQKRPRLRTYSVDADADSEILTWIEGKNYGKNADYQNAERFENMQKIVWGNDGRTAKYPDRQTLLEDFGFWETEPFYEYYNTSGNLQLELYFDPVTEKGCGIRYEYFYTDNLEKKVSMHGFVFDSTYAFQWEEEDAFSTKSWSGTDGSNSVKEYEEQVEYRQDGRPDYYKSQGIVDWVDVEERLMWLLDIDWVYRDDGTLYYKDYDHNSYIFGTSCSYIWGYYDEAERPIYESSYITHGKFEDYYIYQDGGKKPTYCLSLDDNLGYYIPVMHRYE